MSEKYEEFKGWVFCNSQTSSVLHIVLNLFDRFEKEQEEKWKEKEIKHIITEYCSDVVTDKIYNALKERDLIK